MAYEELKVLAASYPAQGKDALIALGGKYHRRCERELLELAAIAADVTLDDIVDLGREPEADPQLTDALDRLGYTEDKLASLRDATPEQLAGHINHIKGTYFETLIRDHLNSGESVGGIKLAPGEEASLAEKLNEPGDDLVIRNKETGDVVDEIQLKATDHWNRVAESLDKYGDTQHLVTEELADRATSENMVAATNIKSEALEDTVREQIKEATESVAKDILDQGLEAAFDTVPLASLPLIIGTEVQNVLRNRSTVRESWQRGKRRVVRAGGYSAIGVAVNATPAAPVSVPITVGLRLIQSRVELRATMGNHLEEKTHEIIRTLQAK